MMTIARLRVPIAIAARDHDEKSPFGARRTHKVNQRSTVLADRHCVPKFTGLERFELHPAHLGDS
jgi:hypothetical protein